MVIFLFYDKRLHHMSDKKNKKQYKAFFLNW